MASLKGSQPTRIKQLTHAKGRQPQCVNRFHWPCPSAEWLGFPHIRGDSKAQGDTEFSDCDFVMQELGVVVLFPRGWVREAASGPAAIQPILGPRQVRCRSLKQEQLKERTRVINWYPKTPSLLHTRHFSIIWKWLLSGTCLIKISEWCGPRYTDTDIFNSPGDWS